MKSHEFIIEKIKRLEEGKDNKIAQLKKDHDTAVHWSKNETSPQKREAARQKAEKIKRHLDTQYRQGVAEVSDATLTSYLTKLDKDNLKHRMDPTKRSDTKRMKSGPNFVKAFTKLDNRKQGMAEGSKDNEGSADKGAWREAWLKQRAYERAARLKQQSNKKKPPTPDNKNKEKGVAEGAVKELSMDLRTMSDQAFQRRYKMTKAQARANLKIKPENMSEMRGFRGVGGARGRENDENEKIDAMLRQQDQQRRDYEQTGKFWLKQKDTQQHISDAMVGKAAASTAAVELLKQRPELRGNLVITAYGPGESQGVAEGQLDEIFNPSSIIAHFIRTASNFANDFIPAGLGALGTFAATTAVLGPVAGALAGSTVGNQVFQTLQNQQNKVPGMIQQLVQKYFGSEAEALEFAVLHAKAAFLEQPKFRWRGKQWPVSLKKNDAEAIIEKNDKYWLEQQAQQQGVAESSDELYGLRVGDTVKATVRGNTVQGDVIDIFPETMEVELLLRGANAGRTVTVDVRDTEALSEQGVAEGSKEKTPGVALSKAYKKDFDDKKPGHTKPDTALTGAYSKTGKPGGELKKKGVAEGYYDLPNQGNVPGMEPIDFSSKPSFKELITRYTQLVYQGHASETSPEEDQEYDAIEKYVAQRFGEKGSAHLQKAGEVSYWGRNDKPYGRDSRSSNLGRPNQPSGDFRTTKAGKMHGQDAKMMKAKVADRVGRHPEPNLPEGVNGEYDDEAGLADQVYAEFERMYPNLARRADDRVIHNAIMSVLNYGGDNDPGALAGDVARAVKQQMQSGVEEGVTESVYSLEQAHAIFDDFEQAMADRGLTEDIFNFFTDEEIILETAAWRRSAGKSKKGGLNAKGVASYRRENPGSKLQMAVTTKPSKLKPGSKAAKRRKSFCARMGGVKGPMKKPNGKPTRKALALRKWNC